MHTVYPLYSGLCSDNKRPSVPSVNFHAPRLVAQRGEGRNEGTPVTKLENRLQPTPTPLCGLA